MEEVEDIAKVVVNYFDNLFSAGSCDQMEEYLEFVSAKVTSEMQNFLSVILLLRRLKQWCSKWGQRKHLDLMV